MKCRQADYKARRARQIDRERVIPKLVDLLRSNGGAWVGSAGDLATAIDMNASALGFALHRIERSKPRGVAATYLGRHRHNVSFFGLVADDAAPGSVAAALETAGLEKVGNSYRVMRSKENA